ncbi:MAG: UDP-N-acetylglucosamine--N-acetylmuramyl-(pentapeptide) pyrophosphoryl-undecaprenol N-acetylglucosamine transferase [Candidatus Sabulitectum sp.]|nr:UDP-N-acetylglucosamine--N-acetylmuramyl-(pentapeptide) pyrophosphoryl-undecaprenol N-acetylglucosamine transferase [Candidatus Sabulitectum sp.]
MSMSRKHLLIAGGGTGGHIAPAIAVGERASDFFKVSYASTPRPVDSMMYSAVTSSVHVMNPPRVDKGMRLLLPFTALRAFFKARSLLRSIKADVVLGTGGYSSFFAIAAARSLGIPAAIFDSNVIPGKSNRIASRFCKVAFTGLPGGEVGLSCAAILTGTPVSGKMKRTPVSIARKTIGIPEDRPVLLFLGGSQGARAINDLALGMKEDVDVSVLLQCGKSDYQRVLQKASHLKNVIVKPFVDLSLWYSASDLVTARAGGQTIAELSAFGLPVVLIPFPHSAENHQIANAAAIEETGGAILRSQREVESPGFDQFLIQLIDNREELAKMSMAMKSIFPSDPAENIVSHLRELL